MVQFNPNVYRRQVIDDPVGAITSGVMKGYSFGDMIRKKKEEREFRDALESSMTQNADGSMTLDPQGFKTMLQRNPERALKIKGAVSADKAAREQARMKNILFKAQQIGRDFSDVTDQTSYLQAMKSLGAKGITLPDAPAIYNKQYVDDMKWQSVDFLDREKLKKDKNGLTAYQAAMLGYAGAKNLREQLQFERDYGPGSSKFASGSYAESSKNYEALQKSVPTLRSQLSQVAEAREATIKYLRESNMGGTGQIETLMGAKKYLDFSGETEQLANLYTNINLKELRKLAEGMSKAFDSNAERRAFESAMLSITNRGRVNIRKLYDLEVGIRRMQAEADAQQRHVMQFGDLRTYQSPSKDTAPVVSRGGDLVFVPKDSVAEYERQGYSTILNYSNRDWSKKKRKMKKKYVPSTPQIYKTNEIDWAD